MKKIILSAAILLSAFAGIAQIKEGSITYDVVGVGLPPEMAMAMEGTEQIITFKNDKRKIEFQSAAFNLIFINDGKNSTVLRDQMGQKTYTQISNEEVKKKEEKTEDPIIEYKDETKNVAGYDCKKAIVKVKSPSGEVMTFIAWYTEELPLCGQTALMSINTFKGLKGAPLEYEGKAGPFDAKYTATSISKNAVKETTFVPNTEGYVKKSSDEMKKMGGGK